MKLHNLFYCYIKTAIALLVIFTGASCKKFVETPAAQTFISEQNAFSQDATAIAVLTGIYTNMSATYASAGFTGGRSISLLTGLSADELSYFNNVVLDDYPSYYENQLQANAASPSGSEFWTMLYGFIYETNAAIEGLSSSDANGTTPAVRQQLLGEAKFLRAFFYFYLTNMYGEAPLITSSDYKVSSLLPRSSQSSIYEQIVSDLRAADGLLSANYLDGTLLHVTSNRVRPTKWAAQALLSRAFLYTSDWRDAELEADSVIANGSFSLVPNLNNVFLVGSQEAIWQLQPTVLGHNTEDGWVFVLPATGPDASIGYPVYMNRQLLRSFEQEDQRRKNWVDSVIVESDTFYYPFKYKVATLNAAVTEYQMVMRMSEQYLIRADARNEQNNTSGAQADLNAVRARAGLPATAASDQASLRTAILHERQVELFTEWGDRWFELKRTSNVDAVMKVATPLKAMSQPWQSYQQLYPLPVTDIKADDNLEQNGGY